MTRFAIDRDSHFRLDIDDWTGGYVSDVSADRLADNQFVRLIDGLISRPGALKTRGILALNADGSAGAIDTGTSGSIRLQTGSMVNRGTLPVYGKGTVSRGQIQAAPVTYSTWNAGPFIGPAAVVDSTLIARCNQTPHPTIARLFAEAFSNCDLQAGVNVNVTWTNGSATITSVGGFTSSMVGAYLWDPQTVAWIGSASFAVYKIAKYVDANTVTLNQIYTGTTQTLSTKINVSTAYCAVQTFSTGSTVIQPLSVCPAWGRVVFGGVVEWTKIPAGGTTITIRANRVAWTGLAGSTEGTAPCVGIAASHPSGYVDLPSDLGDVQAVQQFGTVVAAFCQRGIVILRGAPVFDGAGSLDASTIYRGYSLSSPDCFCITPYGLVFYDQFKGLHILTDNGQPPRSLSVNKVDVHLKAYPPTNLGYASDHVFMLGSSRQLMYSFVRDAFVELDLPVLSSAIPGRGGTEELLALHPASGKIVDVGGILTAGGGTDAVSDSGTHKAQLRYTSKSFGDHHELLRPTRVLRSETLLGGTGGATSSFGTRVGYPGMETVQTDPLATPTSGTDVQRAEITTTGRNPLVSVTYDGAAGVQLAVNRHTVKGAYELDVDP